MQFNLWPKKGDKYNCAGCEGKMHKCLLENESVEIKSVNLPSFTVTLDDWQEPIEAFRKIVDRPDYPIVKILESYNLCPKPLITSFSAETWNLFNAIGGIGKVNSPQEYYALQALYVDGVNIIQKTMMDIQPYLKADS